MDLVNEIVSFVSGPGVGEAHQRIDDSEAALSAEIAQLRAENTEIKIRLGVLLKVLMEKGVAFDSHYLDLLNFEQHKPDYVAINPQGTIPAMKHGNRVLTESTAIMEYVDEVFAGPALMRRRTSMRSCSSK